MAINRTRLRKFRKHAHLSQRELAFLVGVQSQGLLSDVEAGRKRAGLTVNFGCEIVFGTPLRELHVDAYSRMENEVFERALQLHAELANQPNRADAVSYVATLISRLDGNNTRV